MARNRFHGKAKYLPETEYDDDLTQIDSPPSNKRPNLEEYIADTSNSSQDIFTEIQNEPNSQKSSSEQMGEYDKNDVGTMTNDRSIHNKFVETGTMTEPGLTCSNNTDMEIRCNEFFGSVVACELAKYHGQARYDKMKAIIDTFKESKK